MKVIFFALVAMAAFTEVARAQWGTGGGQGASAGTAVPRSVSIPGMKDILDEIAGFDDTKPQAQEPSMTAPGKRPAPGGEDYTDRWMPTARKGFEIPQKYKRPLMENGKAMGSDDDTDVEGQMLDKARKEMPSKAPGTESRRIDKCLKQVARFCSFGTMDKDFAAFSMCCYDVRHMVKQNCFEWCDNQGRCAAEMKTHCAGLSPMETTECMVRKRDILSTDCVDSPTFQSMEDGIEEARKSNKRAEEARSSRPSAPTSDDDGPKAKEADGGVDVLPPSDDEAEL